MCFMRSVLNISLFLLEIIAVNNFIPDEDPIPIGISKCDCWIIKGTKFPTLVDAKSSILA